MKTSDYVTVGFIAIFVTVLAYFLVNSLLGDPSEASVKFEYLDGTTSSLTMPDPEVFNAAAINPTVEVYIGSCVDENQDGILSEQERRDCGMDAYDASGGNTVTESNYSEGNNGLSDEENNAVNQSEGYANGTTAQQREAVNNSVNEYQQQQQTQNQSTQNADDAAARQETVSGS